MPFKIVRNDITKMQADAIVNAANPEPVVGYGVDAGIHLKAGKQLRKAREQIGSIAVGHAAITPAFALDAKYVIHAVGPAWQGGGYHEEALLYQCYRSALELALQYHCESIAFPLLSAGNYGFPKDLALQTAVRAFSCFLMEHDMQITLVVFTNDAFTLSEKLFHDVASYIDENYISEKLKEEYGIGNKRYPVFPRIRRKLSAQRYLHEEKEILDAAPLCAPLAAENAMPLTQSKSLEMLLEETDAGFSETLLQLIDRTGKKDSEIYKKANIDRKLFSKIRNNKAYKPSKSTALAFAIALELDLEETKDFIARAGFALSHSSKFDIIVEYFILHGNYNVFELNEVLFAFDQPLIGA